MSKKVSIDYVYGKLEEMEKAIDENFNRLFGTLDRLTERMCKSEKDVARAKGFMVPIASTAGIVATAVVNFLFGHWGAK
ncbi:MAG: hypothetical protein LBD99_06595 [Candidatus Margulisbacteria bacterium]|jgi:hypothetical protein|nr:hypothetical protein [Candidatus Margulisiibacteriota bacterium]